MSILKGVYVSDILSNHKLNENRWYKVLGQKSKINQTFYMSSKTNLCRSYISTTKVL